MDLNEFSLSAYFPYLLCTIYITVFVGKSLYNQGEVFLVDLFNGNRKLARAINKLLLIGYYLVNIGYATLSLSWWHHRSSWIETLAELNWRIGWIMVGLSIMHYLNIFLFTLYSKRIQSLYQTNIN